MGSLNLSDILYSDPTLQAADDALAEKHNNEKPRPYLGMSSIGDNCQRKLWYRFRLVLREVFDVLTIKRFEDGHRSETLIIDRLKMVKGLTVLDLDENGKQFGFTEHNGHYKGHADGKIWGLIQAPVVKHILEVKCCSEKKFNELKKAIADVGEKNALRKWNHVYYSQGQEYLRHTGFTRHYLVVCTAGGRDWIAVRTDVDVQHGLQMQNRAKRIINSNEPLEKIGDKTYFECKWCAFKDVCHSNAMPDRNCRTCTHSTPIEDGQWHCSRWGKNITFDEQLLGCPAHLFLHTLVPGEVTGVTDNSITYTLFDGSTWIDSEEK